MTHALPPSDLDLLLAAFHAHPDARDAWARWRSSVDWEEHLGGDAFALLPEVCRNQQDLGVDDPLFPRFRGIARQAWVANQRAKSALPTRLPAGRIPELLLLPPTSFLFEDGTAVLQHRRDWRLAVRPSEAAAAVRALLQAGWRADGPRIPPRWLEGYVRGADHVAMALDDGERLTLTWRLDAWLGDRAEAAWADAATVGPESLRLRCLRGTDAIEFVLRQPVAGRPLRWIGDVLRLAGPGIDWAMLHRELSRRPLVGEAADLLPVLDRLLGDRDGATLARALSEAPSKPAPTSSFATRCREDWARYRASWGREYRWPRAVAQLPGYMMGRWGAATPGELARGLVGWIRFGRDGGAR